MRYQEPDSILIVILQGLGDLVLSVPALRAVRKHFPNARIDLMAPSLHIDILEGQCGVDRWIRFPPQLWPRRTMKDLPLLAGAIRPLRRQYYRLLIDLTTPLSAAGWLRLQAVTRGIGALRIVSPEIRDCICYGVPGSSWQGMVDRNRISERAMKFRFLRRLGIVDTGEPPRLSVTARLRTWSQEFLRQQFQDNGNPVIGLCIGGNGTIKRYPLDRLAAALDLVGAHLDANWICFGAREEEAGFRLLQSRCHVPLISQIGALPLRNVVGLIEACDAFLSNDTGLMHVAAAVDTPVVGIFGPGDLCRYEPLGSHHRALSAHAACSPCHRSVCADRQCMETLSPRTVASALVGLVRERSAPTAQEPFRLSCSPARVPAIPGRGEVLQRHATS